MHIKNPPRATLGSSERHTNEYDQAPALLSLMAGAGINRKTQCLPDLKVKSFLLLIWLTSQLSMNCFILADLLTILEGKALNLAQLEV